MPNVRRLLDARVSAAIAAAFPDAADAPAIVQPAQNPDFGDYQANGAMALAKRLGANPREVAQRVVEQLKTDADLAAMAEEPEIAGPGFINFRLKADWVAARLGEVNRVEAGGEDRLGVEAAAEPETVVVDYSAPNLAKEMHVGHLRSTIIGDALVRMLDFAGHNVERQNHVGDWGTQFGMLITHMRDVCAERFVDYEIKTIVTMVDPELIGDLEEFYRQAKVRFDTEPEFRQRSREAVVRLQSDDRETKELWHGFREVSLDHCRAVYRRLGVLLKDDDVRGESAYNHDLPEIIRELGDEGLLRESAEALCVFDDDIKKVQKKKGLPTLNDEISPVLVQKADGGYLYATTDLAAIRYRVHNLNATKILYVTDARQALHFRQVFEVARAAGFWTRGVELKHVGFGTMMGADGKPFKTREGGTVKLMDLLDEAERRARDLVERKQAERPDDQPRLSEDEKQDIARKVGIGGVKYADLAQNRTSDYVFSWDKMLSLQGNTAPYMQYAYARVRSIFQKGFPDEAERRRVETELRADASPIPVPDPAEAALGKMLLRFPETLARALADYRPNVLAAYLYDLAQSFTAFYDACPVLKSDEATRRRRLRLSGLTARVIRKGLDLLGIETAERM